MAERNAKEALGVFGESYACNVLERLGYLLVERNWRCPWGEIDIIMMDGDELVFVEVKTRRGHFMGTPDEAVSRSKVKKLLSTGSAYITRHTQFQDRIWRIDLMAVDVDPLTKAVEYRHYINAFVTG